MPDKWMHILGAVPFLIVSEHRIHLNAQRIIEGIIIAAVTGLLAGYVMVQKMDIRVGYIEKNLEKTVQTQEKLTEALYKHIIDDKVTK